MAQSPASAASRLAHTTAMRPRQRRFKSSGMRRLRRISRVHGIGTVADLGLHQPHERPSFQVRDLDGLVEAEPAAGALQPAAKVDIFDARPPESLVEPADALETGPADSAARAPERKRLFARRLVDEVVREILATGKRSSTRRDARRTNRSRRRSRETTRMRRAGAQSCRGARRRRHRRSKSAPRSSRGRRRCGRLAGPRFSGNSTTRAPDARASAATSGPPPSTTTTTSCGGGSSRRIAPRQDGRVPPACLTGTTIDTVDGVM